MIQSRELLAAGIVRDIAFKSSGLADKYLRDLDEKKKRYIVLESLRREDGSVILRIVQQYNGSPLIQLYE